MGQDLEGGFRVEAVAPWRLLGNCILSRDDRQRNRQGAAVPSLTGVRAQQHYCAVLVSYHRAPSHDGHDGGRGISMEAAG